MKWLMAIVAITFVNYLQLANGSICNEAICASVVSKCMLTQSCKCDLSHCSCCQDCFNCLSYLYDECCSCVDMCPGTKATVGSGIIMNQESFIEEIPYSIPGLFNDLTDTPDQKNRWRSVSIVVPALSLKKTEEDTYEPNKLMTNCTVAYMSQCMPWKKCKSVCESMGSSSFRWFRVGCCECIGESCKESGSEDSRCQECSQGNREETIEDQSDLDYSEDDDPQGDMDD